MSTLALSHLWRSNCANQRENARRPLKGSVVTELWLLTVAYPVMVITVPNMQCPTRYPPIKRPLQCRFDTTSMSGLSCEAASTRNYSRMLPAPTSFLRRIKRTGIGNLKTPLPDAYTGKFSSMRFAADPAMRPPQSSETRRPSGLTRGVPGSRGTAVKYVVIFRFKHYQSLVLCLLALLLTFQDHGW
jgi:hypothetical protein